MSRFGSMSIRLAPSVRRRSEPSPMPWRSARVASLVFLLLASALVAACDGDDEAVPLPTDASDPAERDTYLAFERGPSEEVRLQRATWRDAADMEWESRIWQIIHDRPGDRVGRMEGVEVARWALAWAPDNFLGDGPIPDVPVESPDDVPLDPTPDPDDDSFPAEVGAPADGDSHVGVGTGRQRFEPLAQGDALRWEAGVQGGHHVWVTAALAHAVVAGLSEEERRDVQTRIRLQRRDGSVLGELSRRGGYREADAQWELTGSFLILTPGLRPHRLDDEPLLLQASVVVPGNAAGERRVWVRSACCD